MTFVSDTPCVGIVYKKKDGSTFTEWHHTLGIAWHTPPEIWVKRALYFSSVAPVHMWPKPMAVVRSK
jgi:hypothetical protein